MSNLSPFSSMASLLQTSSIVWQSVSLTDELKINLEYDVHRGLLNIFVKNIGDQKELPCHINVLSNQSDECQIISNTKNNFLIPPEIQQDPIEVTSDSELTIRYEVSTTYVYDIPVENEHLEPIDFSTRRIVSSSLSSSSSSGFDEPTTDNDDGYSTHSLDDIEQQQQQPLAIPSSKLIVPSLYFQHHSYYSEQCVSPIRRLIEHLTWLSPFKKTVKKMMMSHRFP